MSRAPWGGPFDGYYRALAGLKAEFVALRYWMPNPRLTVAELTRQTAPQADLVRTGTRH